MRTWKLMRFLLRLCIVLMIPIVLIVASVRLVTLPWYPVFEYNRADFPPDMYGMSAQERLSLARECIDFLNTPRGTFALEETRFFAGALAFTDREVSHMQDVKRVYDGLTAAAWLALAIVLLAGWLLARYDAPPQFWMSVSDGGLWTLLLLFVLGIVMVSGWGFFFTAMHDVFFKEGTWIFAHSDTLIRLFPMKFWQDAGLMVVILVASGAFLSILVGRVLAFYVRRDGV
jgi:integral membrane protein (TIGR01906 family)